MTQARIEINGTPGSNDALPINALVQLSNDDNLGELTYLWSILDQPPGPVDSLSATNIENPTFTPKKEGSYLLQLIVNFGLPDEKIDKAIVGIRQLKTLERIPAAGETVEVDLADGWASAMNSLLRRIDALLSDPGSLVGENTSGGVLTHGDVVRVTSGAVIKAGLPGQETVPGFTKALASSLDNMDELLCVVEGDVAGNLSVSAGELAKVRYIGRIATVPLGSGAIGDPVYVSNTATLSVSPGSYRRQVGSIMSVSGGNRDVWFDGVGGADITPIDRAYMLYGAPSSGMLNAHRFDGNNATPGATVGVPYVFKAGDAATVALVAKRFNAGGADPFQVQTEAGVPLTWFTAAGNLDLNLKELYRSVIRSPADATVANIVKRWSGTQTADLSQWQDELGTALLKVTSSGALTLIASDLDANTKRVVNLSDPALAQDAATKAYVDLRPVQNYIENGGFDFFQRYERTTLSLTNVRAVGFHADRWSTFNAPTVAVQGGDSGPYVLSSVERDGSGDLQGIAVRCTGGTVPKTYYTTQEINRDYMSKLAGQPTIFTFKARRTSGGPTTITARVASATVFNPSAATPDYPTTHQQDALASFTLTTSWQTFSLVVPAFRAGISGVSIQLYYTFATTSASEYVQIRQAMLAVGALVQPWVRCARVYRDELGLCMAFFEKSFEAADWYTAVASYPPPYSNNESIHETVFLPIAIANGQILPIVPPRFLVQKSRPPSVAVYSAVVGSANTVYDVGGAATRAIIVSNISRRGFNLLSNQGPPSYTPASPNICRFHWTASAEYV